jgi:hypothetical protein
LEGGNADGHGGQNGYQGDERGRAVAVPANGAGPTPGDVKHFLDTAPGFDVVTRHH